MNENVDTFVLIKAWDLKLTHTQTQTHTRVRARIYIQVFHDLRTLLQEVTS